MPTDPPNAGPMQREMTKYAPLIGSAWNDRQERDGIVCEAEARHGNAWKSHNM